ncbi:EamA-like transporter family protein [Bacteriovorax sp. BSW11_IV]|uniref:EamA family transporter n=1 Tax=Bacteriovorax sp. BSW11_IV TaxID=1353529 RepID=UPI00038A1FD2|nr:EamA family transporter [Bacteriovorax sp. BSW11_IV]EQC46405.1 EamA-like transporter family protein [Bacteriovorax sp. BSW11_IV]
MLNLWIVTFVWAFSFPLIGHYISGQIDSYLAILIRFVLAALCFIPFTSFTNNWKLKAKVALCGLIQVGLMYLCFYKSFAFLKVPEVILFTITTPLYIALIGDFLEKRFSPNHLLAALVAILGSYIIRYQQMSNDVLVGLLLVQGSNICFAIGQVFYRKLKNELEEIQLKDRNVFFYFYFGASVFIGLLSLLFSNFNKIPTTTTQYFVLLWLGIIASGLCYFLWNTGAKKVEVGILAVMNNMVIPVGIFVSFMFFGDSVDIVPFSIGTSVLVLSLVIANYEKNKRSQKQRA